MSNNEYLMDIQMTFSLCPCPSGLKMDIKLITIGSCVIWVYSPFYPTVILNLVLSLKNLYASFVGIELQLNKNIDTHN